MVAIVQDDVVYGRNLPGTLLFSIIFIVDLISTFDSVVGLRWRQALHYSPMMIDLITKAFLLHRPLTPAVKTLCIFVSAATALGSAIIYFTLSAHLGGMVLFTAVQSAMTVLILFLEHTLIGKLFMPFTRTNSEVVIM